MIRHFFGKKDGSNKKIAIEAYLINTVIIVDNEKKNLDEFNKEKYELEATSNMQLIEVINQLEKIFKISIRDYELFTRYKYLSEDNDNELLGELFKNISGDKPKELYLYPKSEIYEVKIQYKNESFALKIHDSMKIKTIINICKEKYHKDEDKIYELVIDNTEANENLKALNYNMRKAKRILFWKLKLWG